MLDDGDRPPSGGPAAARPRRLQGGQRQPRATTPATSCCARSARGCSPALRPGDLLARLGGDEFAVLLPDAGLDEAEERAERLRELVLQPFTVEGIRLHVGVSIGVATRTRAGRHRAGAAALRRRRDVRRQVRPRGRARLRARPARRAPATACAPWRSSGRRSSADELEVLPPAAGRPRRRPGRRGRRRSSGGTTRPAACSPPPSCCPPPSRPACSARSPTPCSSWR